MEYNTFIIRVIGYLWLLLPFHSLCWKQCSKFTFWMDALKFM